MCTLYETIIRLCESKGIRPATLCRDIGIRPSLISDLKSGRKRSLSASTADKIARYFGVSVAYLLGTDEKQTPAAPENGDGRPYEEVQLLRWFSSLPPEKRQAMLALGDAPEELRAYLERERSDKSK